MQIFTLKWHGPYDLFDIEHKDIAYEYGIYAIYQLYRDQEKLLYIGKTSRAFITRLNEHLYWLNDLRGQLKVRLAVIELDNNQRYSKKRLGDIESLLISWHSPPKNTINVNYYYGREKLTVLNIGRRGQIVSKVSTNDLEWC